MSPTTKAWRYLRFGPSHFTMFIFGRFNSVRSIVQRRYRRRASSAAILPTDTALETSVLEHVDVECAADAVRKNGYFPGLRLHPGMLEKLLRFSTTTTCLAEGQSQYPFIVGQRNFAEQKYQKKIRLGRFDHAMRSCPEVHSLISDPTIIAIATKYLGCGPVFLGARMWWSFPSDANTSEQMSLGQGFHYDLDGYASLAFFFYLTDVDPTTGPHIVVRGSHSKKPLKGLLSMYRGRPDSQIEKWYGRERLEIVCGSASFGFAEDIFCYHKGLNPQSGERLLLQLRYGIRSYSDPWESIDG